MLKRTHASKAALALILAPVIVAAWGCGPSYTLPRSYDFANAREYDRPSEQLFNRAVEWFALAGIPIRNMDRPSGLIASDYNLATSDTTICDCGQGGKNIATLVIVSDRYANFNLLLQRLSDTRTKATVTAKFYANLDRRQNTGTELGYQNYSYDRIECNSTGALETELLDYMGR